MAPIQLSDQTTGSFNPGDIASRAMSGGINFGVTGQQQTQMVMWIAIAAVGLYLISSRKKKT